LSRDGDTPCCVWLVSLPLAAGGWLAAHWLAYALVASQGGHHGRALSDAGHGYLGAAPVFAAFAITLLLAGVALAFHNGVRRGPAACVPLWPVALISPLDRDDLPGVVAINANGRDRSSTIM
jgi:hypothetical protein